MRDGRDKLAMHLIFVAQQSVFSECWDQPQARIKLASRPLHPWTVLLCCETSPTWSWRAVESLTRSSLGKSEGEFNATRVAAVDELEELED